MDEDPTTFVLRVATLNVRGYERKKTQVLATALRHKVDVQAVTETRSRTRISEGRVEGADYDLWDPGETEQKGKRISSTREHRSRRSPRPWLKMWSS